MEKVNLFGKIHSKRFLLTISWKDFLEMDDETKRLSFVWMQTYCNDSEKNALDWAKEVSVYKNTCNYLNEVIADLKNDKT